MTPKIKHQKKWSKIENEHLGKKNSRQRHTIGLTFFKLFILWAQSSMPKIENDPPTKSQKKLSKQIKKTENLGKKNSRQLRQFAI